MEKFRNNCIIGIEYKKDHLVMLKKDLSEKEFGLLQDYIKEFNCKVKAEITFFFNDYFTIIIKGKNTVEMLQDKDFKQLLFNPEFDVLKEI